jgi:hypothetical protein
MAQNELWQKGTEQSLHQVPVRKASISRTWLARSADGLREVVLKEFANFDAFERERAAYEDLYGRFAGVAHYVGAGWFGGRPTIVQERLLPIDWSGHEWATALEQTVALRTSLAFVRCDTACGAPRSMQSLFSPTFIWLAESGHEQLRARLYGFVTECACTIEWSHGDLHPPNLMKTKTGEVRFIDWERVAPLPDAWDYAAVTVGAALRRPTPDLPQIFQIVAPAVKNRDLFVLCVLAEMLELAQYFRHDEGMASQLSKLLANFLVAPWLA